MTHPFKLLVSSVCLLLSVATSNAATTASGPLRVHPANPRYFADEHGTVVLLTGSHVWNQLADMGDTHPLPRFDFTAYVDFLQQHGHNFIRLWRFELSFAPTDFPGIRQHWDPHPWPRSGPGIARDGHEKFDLNQLNQAYFERLRSRVVAARDRGIYVGIMLFEGWGLRVKPTLWAGHPMNAANNINGIDGDPNGDGFGLEVQTLAISAITSIQKAYVRKVIDTVNDLPNVLYEISNESEYAPAMKEWQYEMINYVNQYQLTKSQQHPVGMTDVTNTDNSVLFSSSADWISPGLVTWNASDVYSVNPPATSGKKVEILDSDHTWNNACGTWSNEQRADRVWVWKSVLRGYNPIYMDPIELSAPNQIMKYAQRHAAAITSARAAMGNARSYANRIGLAAMVPMDDLCSTTYCLARPGSEYLAYQPDNGLFTVSLLTGTYRYEWFSPARGVVVGSGEVTVPTGLRSFTAPFEGDALLYLKSQRRTHGPPSVGRCLSLQPGRIPSAH